jgi:hypothetical protein
MRQSAIRRVTQPLLLALLFAALVSIGSPYPTAAQSPDDLTPDDRAVCRDSGGADRDQAACVRTIVPDDGSGRGGGGLPLPDLVTATACRADAAARGVVACTVTMTNQGPEAATFPAGTALIHATASVSTGAVTFVHIGWDRVARSAYATTAYACPPHSECTAGVITNAARTLRPGESWSFATAFRAPTAGALVTTLATADPDAAIPELYEDNNRAFATSAALPPR